MAKEAEWERPNRDSGLVEMVRKIKDKQETLRLQKKAEEKLVPKKHRRRL